MNPCIYVNGAALTQTGTSPYILSDEKTFDAPKKTWAQIPEEKLLRHKVVDIWVEARKETSCLSEKTRVKLVDSIKYEKPQNVSVLWSQNNLSLTWRAVENYRASVDVWHRKDSAQAWHELQWNTTMPKDNKYEINMVNLEQHSADHLQIRHRSTAAKSPLWSEWSDILTTPIKFVRVQKKIIDKTRRLRLRWKPVTRANGEAVSYQVDTQSFKKCPCHKAKHQFTTNKTTYDVYISYSATNISVTAHNEAGFSPAADFNVPPENPANLEVCNVTALNIPKTKRLCCEWYELRDGKVVTETVMFLASKNDTIRKHIQKELKEYLPYVYLEHQCINNKPKNVKMCLYYKTEGKPNSYPQHFITSQETHNSASLSWQPIPTVHQRGFITHYELCIVKASSEVSSEGEEEEKSPCRNISASLKEYKLEDLTPGTKYNITLVGVTRFGKGPPANATINTRPEKPVNLWLSFGLMITFFLISTSCTVVLRRVKNKILPPVPIPVIPEFPTNQPETRDLLERTEEVHEVTLVQLHPERSLSEDLEKSKDPNGKQGESSDVDEDDEEKEDRILKTGSDKEQPKDSTEEQQTDLDQVQNEIALLIYRNGLVFDVNMDSS